MGDNMARDWRKMDNDIFEDWNTFKTESRKEFMQVKYDLSVNIKKNSVLLERRAYLQSLCEWIDEEENKLAIGK